MENLFVKMEVDGVDGSSKTKKMTTAAILSEILVFFVVLVILLFAGKFLWNTVIAGAGGKGLITIAKPATSIWQILGLVFMASLIP